MDNCARSVWDDWLHRAWACTRDKQFGHKLRAAKCTTKPDPSDVEPVNWFIQVCVQEKGIVVLDA